MKGVIGWVIGAAIALSALPASAQNTSAASGLPSKQCLTDEAKETIKKLRALTRSVTPEDPVMPFDPDYFVGRWDVEWDVPESPFGQAGTLMGTLAIQHVEGCLYEGTLTGTDPEGAFTSKVQIVFDPTNKYLVWIETHSRGYTLIKPGPVGGDNGGTFTHFWEVPPTKVNGKIVRLKGFTLLTSPVNYRLRAQISVDGDAYVNYGNPWFRKQGAGRPSAAR